MKTTKEQKKKIVFTTFTVIITAFIILTLWENPLLKSNQRENSISTDEIDVNYIKICENNIINEFQLINPEFQRENNDGEETNNYIGKVRYYESENEIRTTKFECKIGNNGNDTWINRDTESTPGIEEIIYDDRN